MKLIIVFIAIIGIFILNTGCSGEPKQTEISANLSNYLSLIPKQTNVLFYANFENLKQTPLGEDIRSELEKKLKEEREDEDYLRFVEETGIDLKRDIYEIWVGANAVDNQDKQGGAIIRGKFNKERIIDYVKREKSHKLHKDSYKSFNIYLLNDDDKAFTFLNNKTVAIGNLYWLQKVISQSKNGEASVLNNSAMAELLAEVSYKKQLWGILNLKELTGNWVEEIRKHGSEFKGTKSLENMQWIVFSAQVEQKANVQIEGYFSTNEEAQLLADMLNGFKAMAKFVLSDDTEAIDMLNEIKISTDGAKVRILARVDRGYFEKLEQKKAKFQSIQIDL